jgi:hypothetical protein
MSCNDSDTVETPLEYFSLSSKLRKRVWSAVKNTGDLADNLQAQKDSPDLCWLCRQLSDLLVAGTEPDGDDDWRGGFPPELHNKIQAFLRNNKDLPEAKENPVKAGIATLIALDDAHIKSRGSGVATALLDHVNGQSVELSSSEDSKYRSWRKRASTFFSKIVSGALCLFEFE